MMEYNPQDRSNRSGEESSNEAPPGDFEPGNMFYPRSKHCQDGCNEDEQPQQNPSSIIVPN